MNKSEIILHNLLNDPRGAEARKVYRTLKEWFEDEFGLAWTLKELAEARMMLNNGSIKKTIPLYFREERKGTFVGTRKLTDQEFTLYCRGLFYMAGFQLLNN